MFYVKNVPGVERGIRITLGLAMLVSGLWALKGSPAGYALAAMGAVALLTGFVGFCPMCAMAGRKLDKGK
ncbi:MAG: DUF2892 domain-containing protein [Fibrobacteres bacterium]|jgi:hypothetical protein|nr:DUF2892 domain-containing protein [Fibrobacterota bacterium]